MRVWKIMAVAATVLMAQIQPAVAQSPSRKVVQFCEDHLGQKVGDGECAALATAALKAAGAKARSKDSPRAGDYVWGEYVGSVEASSGGVGLIGDNNQGLVQRAGDLVQFRNAVFKGKTKTGTYTMTALHHTAVIKSASSDGMALVVYEQNSGTRKVVSTRSIRLNDIKEGWIRFYRPIPAGTF